MADLHAHHRHPGHSSSDRLYWIVAAILAVITGLEVAVFSFNLDHTLTILILIVLSVIKGAAVVMFFMHMRGDAGIFKFVFVAPLTIAISMGLIFLLLFSNHSGIAG